MSLSCINHLNQEHRLILRAVYVLEAMADQAKEGKVPVSTDVDRLLHFFRRYGDDHHQAQEEAVLFPALRKADRDKAARALDLLMFEHEQERSLIEGLEDALRSQKGSDFTYYGRRLADVLGNHIYKEEHILFPLVERTITMDMDERLSREMSAFDNDLRSAHQEMIDIVNDLEWKYLGKAA